MAEIKDGGPAFPHDDRAQWAERAGMTLRDYLAAKAMAVLMLSDQSSMRQDAELAYSMADEMIAARRK